MTALLLNEMREAKMTENGPTGPDELPPVAVERPAGRLSLGGDLLLAVLVV